MARVHLDKQVGALELVRAVYENDVEQRREQVERRLGRVERELGKFANPCALRLAKAFKLLSKRPVTGKAIGRVYGETQRSDYRTLR